jgi:hypothetical protein
MASRYARIVASAALAGFFAWLPMPLAQGQIAADHGAIWNSGDIIYIDLVNGQDLSRDPQSPQYSPGHGSMASRYQTVQHAVQDVLANSPALPVVFNIMGASATHQVSNLALPAYGVKLQPYVDATVTLDGGGISAAVLRVNSEGQRSHTGGGLMPATIIQGLTITGGGVGIHLEVATNPMLIETLKPLRTEVRDCTITGNKFGSSAGGAGGGTGIAIISRTGAPTQYVIEHNRIVDQADFFTGFGGPSSWGISIRAYHNARESSLIRGNELLQQETGIGIYGNIDAWVRPRILSNFMAEHEQHVWSIGDCGPVFINNTVFRTRDYCEGPDRHIIHHRATPVAADTDPFSERTVMIVRNCIFDYFTPNAVPDPIEPLPLGAVRPYDPTVYPCNPPTQPCTNVPWPIATFGGGGTVDVDWSDVELFFGPLTEPSDTPADLGMSPTRPANFVGRDIPFVSIATPPDLHLAAVLGMPLAPMIEGGDPQSTIPSDGLMVRVGDEWLPCDVRTDVDGDPRVCDFDRNGSLLPDRGADEVLDTFNSGVPQLSSGLRLISDADANGNVFDGTSVQFTILGRPNELVVLLGWLDCPTDSFDNVVDNHLFLPPFGNVLLPPCGLVSSATMTLNAQGSATLPLPLSAAPEFQAYFQAIGLSAAGVPATGYASNRVRIELN